MRHLVALLLAVPACVGDEPLGGDGDVAGQENYQSDGKSDAMYDALSAELTAKYGLRPRRYNGLFNDSNEAERRFRAALPGVTAAINARTAATGATFRITEAELATNFITEGGYYMLAYDIHDSGQLATIDGATGIIVIDGFTFLGTDSIVANAAAVSPWLSDTLRFMVNEPTRQTQATNEKGEATTSIWVDNIEQGLELNAAMFAWSRARFAADAKSSYATLGPEARFFWTTAYYNTGPEVAASLLASMGPDWWKTKWTLADDPAKYSRYARYNGLWRTSTWEMLSRTTLAQ